LQKINGHIDNKIVRRRQKQHEQEQKPKQQEQKPKQQSTTPVSSSSNSNPSRALINSTAPSTNDEEYSIFRDPPTTASLPATPRVIFIDLFHSSKTLKFILLVTTTIKNIS
jgi:hypothetical protein